MSIHKVFDYCTTAIHRYFINTSKNISDFPSTEFAKRSKLVLQRPTLNNGLSLKQYSPPKKLNKSETASQLLEQYYWCST